MDGFKKGIDLHGGDPDAVFTAGVRQALQEKSFEHALLAVGTTKKLLTGVVNSAIQEGKGIPELGKDIKNLYDGDMPRYRSLRIARTELTDVINDGGTTTLRREGFKQKEWSTVIDGRERDDHAMADGQTVAIDVPFTVGGESALYPGDSRLSAGQRINCRCLSVGAGMPEDRIKRLGKRFLTVHGALERRFVVQLRQAFNEQRERVLENLPI